MSELCQDAGAKRPIWVAVTYGAATCRWIIRRRLGYAFRGSVLGLDRPDLAIRSEESQRKGDPLSDQPGKSNLVLNEMGARYRSPIASNREAGLCGRARHTFLDNNISIFVICQEKYTNDMRQGSIPAL